MRTLGTVVAALNLVLVSTIDLSSTMRPLAFTIAPAPGTMLARSISTRRPGSVATVCQAATATAGARASTTMAKIFADMPSSKGIFSMRR